MVEGNWHKTVRNKITSYLKNKGYKVDESHNEGDISLFCENKSGKTHLSDVDILASKDGFVKYLIEIQNNISPKTIIGIVSATNLCSYHIDPNDKKVDIGDSILFIVVPEDVISKQGSQKKEQLELIREKVPTTEGSLRGWFYCNEKNFIEAFEKREQIDNKISY